MAELKETLKKSNSRDALLLQNSQQKSDPSTPILGTAKIRTSNNKKPKATKKPSTSKKKKTPGASSATLSGLPHSGLNHLENTAVGNNISYNAAASTVAGNNIRTAEQQQQLTYPEWTDLSSSLSPTPSCHQQLQLNTSSESSCSSSFSSPFNSSMESLHHSPSTAATVSLFKEPDPLFSAVQAPATAVSAAVTVSQAASMKPQPLVMMNNKQLENNNDLIPNNIINTIGNTMAPSNEDMNMIQDFTDFVDMADCLNGMPDIEFVQDNFEMFP